MRRRRARYKRMFGCESGIAAVEFALMLPVMMLLFLGGVEITRYILVNQRMDRAANTVADNIAQADTIASDDIDRLFAAADDLAKPYAIADDGDIIVSSVYKSPDNAPSVRWQYRLHPDGTATSRIGAEGEAAVLPGDLVLQDTDGLIITEVFYRFTPMIGEQVIEAMSVYKVSYFRPRLGTLDVLN